MIQIFQAYEDSSPGKYVFIYFLLKLGQTQPFFYYEIFHPSSSSKFALWNYVWRTMTLRLQSQLRIFFLQFLGKKQTKFIP